MHRRQFLLTGAAAAAATQLPKVAPAPAPVPVIDTHIHLFDTTRKQGVPWPERTSPIYQPALPPRYKAIVAPFNVRGAIVVEASPWFEDNQWVLDIAARDHFILGFVGNLEPGRPEYTTRLLSLMKNPLFRGIRYGNLWSREFDEDTWTPEFIADLRMLAQAGLTLDVANPTPELLRATLRLSDRIPNLRIVIDHLPSLEIPERPLRARECRNDLMELGRRKQIFAKLSAVLKRDAMGAVPVDPAPYRTFLDELVGMFGEDRILFGSDWPNSDRLRPYKDVFALIHAYFTKRTQTSQEKFFWRNSQAAYHWTKRDPSQAL